MKIFVTDKYRIMVFSLICTLIGISFLISQNNADSVSTSENLIPIYSVDRKDNAISITFDCAWGSEDIDKILAILKKHNCKATFFVLGTWAKDNHTAMKKIVADGHEIGNHSFNHKYYTTLSPSEMIDDMNKCNNEIKNACNITPTLFRAPSGDYNNNVIKTCKEAGFEYIQWSVDSLDWKGLSCKEMLERIIPKTKSGDILLFHNGTEHTAASLDRILTELEIKGFRYLKVSDLIYKDNYTIDHTGHQIPSK